MSSSKDNALLKWLIMWLYSVISPIESWLGERVDGSDTEKRPRPYCELAEQLTRKEEYLGDTDALLDATEEARKTIDHQIQSLDDMDSKAVRILRLNVLVLGLLLTGLSIASPADGISLSYLDSAYLFVGLGCIFASTAFAALTYTASEFYPGVDADDLNTIIFEDFTRRELNIVLSNSYAEWIEFNDETNIRNVPLSTATSLCLVAGIAYIGLGVYDSLIGSISVYQEWSVHLIIVVMAVWADFPVQVYRWWKISIWGRVAARVRNKIRQ